MKITIKSQFLFTQWGKKVCLMKQHTHTHAHILSLAHCLLSHSQFSTFKTRPFERKQNTKLTLASKKLLYFSFCCISNPPLSLTFGTQFLSLTGCWRSFSYIFFSYTPTFPSYRPFAFFFSLLLLPRRCFFAWREIVCWFAGFFFLFFFLLIFHIIFVLLQRKIHIDFL